MRSRTLVGDALAHPAIPRVAACLAVGLSWPALSTGWVLDDLHHRAALTSSPVRSRGYELAPGISQLFAFSYGDRAHNQRLMRTGALPWIRRECLIRCSRWSGRSQCRSSSFARK